MSLVIQLCAEEAFKQGYTAMFGVQYYGECWSSKTAESNYNKYGKSKACINGVGKASTNMVYRIKGGFQGCWQIISIWALSQICSDLAKLSCFF